MGYCTAKRVALCASLGVIAMGCVPPPQPICRVRAVVLVPDLTSFDHVEDVRHRYELLARAPPFLVLSGDLVYLQVARRQPRYGSPLGEAAWCWKRMNEVEGNHCGTPSFRGSFRDLSSHDYAIELVTPEERWRVTQRTGLGTLTFYYQPCSRWSDCETEAAEVVGDFADCHSYMNGPRSR